jgi:flagellar hook-length control protein FliK
MLPVGEFWLEATPGSQQPANTVPGVVGEPHWGDAFSQRVVWMVGQQVQSAQFRVEPPQLGPIEVKLSITNDQARAGVAVESESIRIDSSLQVRRALGLVDLYA